MNDMMKNVEMNAAAQETTAIVPTNNTLSTAVQQPAAPAPTDTEMIVTTFVEQEQAPAAAPSDEKKKDEEKKTKKRRTTKHCVPDHDSKTLVVTKATSVPGSDAFNELMKQRTLYPDYKISYRTAKPSENRLSVKDLTADKMEKFIKLNYPTNEKLMKEFSLQKQLSELYSCPITYLRNWFRRNCREYWTNAKKAATA